MRDTVDTRRFLNCGADLVYSAGVLYGLAEERGALDWALRLAGMYTKARHPETGMGAYQFTILERQPTPRPISSAPCGPTAPMSAV